MSRTTYIVILFNINECNEKDKHRVCRLYHIFKKIYAKFLGTIIQARLPDGFSRNRGFRCKDLSNTNIERKDITANFRRSFTKVDVTVGSRNPRGEIIREESSDAARSPIESRGQWRSLRQRRYIYITRSGTSRTRIFAFSPAFSLPSHGHD